MEIKGLIGWPTLLITLNGEEASTPPGRGCSVPETLLPLFRARPYLLYRR